MMDDSHAQLSHGHPTRWQRVRLRMRRASPFAFGVLAAFLGLWLARLAAPTPPPLTAQQVEQAIAQAMASATALPSYSSLVYEIIRPSLVLIRTQSPGSTGRDGFGLGSGVVIDLSGNILTSLHVVEGQVNIQVVFADGSESKAELVAQQPENDIAVLRAERPPELLVPATLGNPNASQVGDEAFAVGNPFGLYSSMTAGVISGFDRSFQPEGSQVRLEGLIQIDAAVNPGNSGGPLLNRQGHVIGIVTGILNPVRQEVFIGIGFAVPINIAGAAAGLPRY
jgi:S1-C subfamily serine protease